MPRSPEKLHTPRQRRYEDTRPNAAARGYGNEWRRVSNAFVLAYPFCVLCLCRGRVNEGARQSPSTRGRSLHVDHITPHNGDAALICEQTNLQTLCATPCHAVEKRRIENTTHDVRGSWFAYLASELIRTQSIDHLRSHAHGVPPGLLEAVADRGGVDLWE